VRVAAATRRALPAHATRANAVAHRPAFQQTNTLSAGGAGRRAKRENTTTMEILLLGLGVGILVGLMGVGGGVVLVPALVYLLHFDQHLAQGTSLLLQLPPIGLGALLLYREKGSVDMHAGLTCAGGFFLGGYFGSFLALGLPSRDLKGMFGLFLMVAAVLLWRQILTARPASKNTGAPPAVSGEAHARPKVSLARLLQTFAIACVVGVAGGLFGVGGGILLVPLLVLLLRFDQHLAQGTSLVALVPPTGLLALINYARAGQVDLRVGLLLMPGVFLGSLAGARLALMLSPQRMRAVFGVLLFVLGAAQAFFAWLR
jgi:uncharacterized membrane protein YfcA